MPELQRRLLTNVSFKRGKMKNRTSLGRAYFRGVAIMVPQIADFSSVYVQCDLSSEGRDYPTPCATSTIAARRLGSKLTYKVQSTGLLQSVWYKQRPKTNTMKLNSLVDLEARLVEGSAFHMQIQLA